MLCCLRAIRREQTSSTSVAVHSKVHIVSHSKMKALRQSIGRRIRETKKREREREDERKDGREKGIIRLTNKFHSKDTGFGVRQFAFSLARFDDRGEIHRVHPLDLPARRCFRFRTFRGSQFRLGGFSPSALSAADRTYRLENWLSMRKHIYVRIYREWVDPICETLYSLFLTMDIRDI